MPRRVVISDTSGGNEYTFPINPIEFENLDDDELYNARTIAGSNIFFKSAIDGRIRKMVWKNLPNRSPYSTLVSTLKSYKGLKKRIYLKDLSGDESDVTYSLIYIINVETRWAIGPENATAKLKYESIVLSYVSAL